MNFNYTAEIKKKKRECRISACKVKSRNHRWLFCVLPAESLMQQMLCFPRRGGKIKVNNCDVFLNLLDACI